MNNEDIVIVAAQRTPHGNMLGALAPLSATQLGGIANQAAIEQSGLSAEAIDEVITGCVLQAGLGQAPARQAALNAGVPESAGATTINKMCGSGMKALMLGCDAITSGSSKLVLTGGMESMSNSPYLLAKARAGYRLGHGEIKDHMFLDGLEDAYDKGTLMGCFAEQTAEHFQFTRESQDAFAIQSLQRAITATSKGSFDAEICPVEISARKQSVTISCDEGPNPNKLEKIARLKPAFSPTGTVTAANSSSISDGASSLIITSWQEAKKRNLNPLAKIVAHSSHAQAPAWFTTAPTEAINKVLAKAQWEKNEVDLFEINEAFAVVTMASIEQLSLSPETVNIHGGACALGHPIGASGARIIVTLLHCLQQYQCNKGVASLCIGGGEATAVAIERIR